MVTGIEGTTAVESGPSRRLRCNYGRIGRMLPSIDAMSAVGWALAETVKQLGLYRPKAVKQGSHKCHGVNLSGGCREAEAIEAKG